MNLLDEHWPLKTYNCHNIQFQRPLDSYQNDSEKLYFILRDILANQGVLFLGGYATRLFAKNNDSKDNIVKKIPDFDVLSDDAETVCTIIIERLEVARQVDSELLLLLILLLLLLVKIQPDIEH